MRLWTWRSWLVLCVGCSLAFSIYAECRISLSANGKMFDTCAAIPAQDVALVLGTSRQIRGKPNPFYEARLDAAAELFRGNKVRAIIVSGDNSRADYNEPRDMKNDLVARGIPANLITCDFAGLRTLDSVQRVVRVFGQSRVVLVSQRFHLQRALFLADHAGLSAVGLVADEVPSTWWRLRARLREILARDAAIVDVVFGRSPRHLGPTETVSFAP